MQKKQKRCDPEKPEDHQKGDCWDYVAYDPEHKLVLKVITGRRHAGQAVKLLEEVARKIPVPAASKARPRQRRRSGAGLLLTTDGYLPYPPAVRRCLGHWPAGTLNYAVLEKQYDKHGRLVSVTGRAVVGGVRSIQRALKDSAASTVINTALIERHNGSERHRNSRKTRRSYRFSKDWEVHQAMSAFSQYAHNFCWSVRTLRGRRRADGTHPPRTPAMAAKLTDHVWSLREWLKQVVAGMNG